MRLSDDRNPRLHHPRNGFHSGPVGHRLESEVNITKVENRTLDIAIKNTRLRIDWSSKHEGQFYDESLKFWVRCLFRQAIDRQHPKLAPELRGYCRLIH